MISNQFALLLRLFVRPAAALSDILDQGRWFAALLLCAAIALILSAGLNPLLHQVATVERMAAQGMLPPGAVLDPMMILLALAGPVVSGLKVPFVLVLVFAPVALAVGRLTGGGRVLDRMVPLSTCLGFAYSAAFLPAAALPILVALPPSVRLGLLVAGALFFLGLAAASARMVLGSDTLSGVLGAGAGAAASLVAGWLLGNAGFLSGFLFSPFLLYFLYMRYSGSISGLADPFKQQQSFRRYLEASTINPHDADAQYQLGLIYQSRRQYTQAIERFEKAIAIDPNDVDSHYQLARIYKDQDRWADALPHLEASIKIDSRHAQFEPARDWAIAKLHLGDAANARITLESYLEQRPYDPEALFYLGKTLAGLGESEHARAALAKAREAVRTTPGYRKHEVRKWGREAATLLRSL
jgi:tetratricopeptide (TPR) repeat protein